MENELILYDHPVSSYAQKIRIALREKQVPFKAVLPGSLRTGVPEAEFLSANPRLEVPTLIDGELQIFDSTIILEYIEDKWSTPALLPKDPAARAHARMIEEVCDTHYEAVNWGIGEVRFFGRASGELADKLITEGVHQTEVLLEWLTQRLKDAPYFNGESFGWADLCAAAFVNRSRYYGCGPTPETSLAKWLDRIGQRESVRATFAEFDAGAGKMSSLKEIFLSGERKREYRDHRLEWLIKSGGIDVVTEGLKNNNIRFSWPNPLE